MNRMMKLGIENRKLEHISLALNDYSQGPIDTWLNYVTLVHQAVADLSFDDIDTSVYFLGYRLRFPLIISGMTGGFSKAYELNKSLAEIAYRYGIGIGVGSQRAMLLNPNTIHTYRIVREIARDVPVIANIGIAQLIEFGPNIAEKVVEAIEADALAIHLNMLQELVQPEGNRTFKGYIDVIRNTVEKVRVPIIVKEVGHGISYELARKLAEIGIQIIDVAGMGGTNWVKIELARYKDAKNIVMEASKDFISWGIPTGISIVEVRSALRTGIVIASGGIRNGIDIAKSIALGADLCGIAQPFLKAIMNNTAEAFIEKIIYQLKMVMMLTSSKDINALKNAPIVIMGRLAEWICSRKLSLRNSHAYISCCNCKKLSGENELY